MAEEQAGKAIYPPRGCRLKALELTPLQAVKVVILGQDPYHNPGKAMGLLPLAPAVLPGRIQGLWRQRNLTGVFSCIKNQ